MSNMNILRQSNNIYLKSFHNIKRFVNLSPILSTKSIDTDNTEEEDKGKWFPNFFVRRLKQVKESQSDLLSDHNNVFELQIHSVRPDSMFNYLSDYSQFVNLIHEKKTGAELVASWTSVIGDQDNAYHLWRFCGGFPLLNKHYKVYRSEPAFEEYRRRRNEMLRKRTNQICHPFSFWPAIAPRPDADAHHIYELRSYTLKPGTMIEWGNSWAQAIRARTTGGEAVAGLFSTVGEMHVVHHIYAYKDLEHRKLMRDNAWRTPGWDECVSNTVPLIRHMSSNILEATPFSPLK